jgi:hypothetical protein
MNRYFSKEDPQFSNKHMKRFPSLAIREIQIKTTLRSHSTLPMIRSVNEDLAKLEPGTLLTGIQNDPGS